MELISIIVPIYKVEEYLSRCVDSIISQTYQNIEVILVNDGSPDNCGLICDAYSEEDKRIKTIHKTNGGLSDARNAGLKIAKGDLITFIDSDDWIKPNYIEELYKLQHKTKADIVISNFKKVSNDDSKILEKKNEVYQFSGIEALTQKYEFNNFGTQLVTAWGNLYKKRLFYDIVFPVGRIHEDEFVTYKLLYKSKKVTLTSAELLYYWQRDDSIMGAKNINVNHRVDAFDAFYERAIFFREVGLLELSRYSFRTVFFKYLDILLLLEKTNLDENYNLFKVNDEDLKSQMRESGQKTFFKFFYEIYFISPRFILKKYKAFKIINKKFYQIVSRL